MSSLASPSSTWTKDPEDFKSTSGNYDPELAADAGTRRKPFQLVRSRFLVPRIVLGTIFVFIFLGVILTGVLFDKSVSTTESRHSLDLNANLDPPPNAPDPGPDALATGITIQMNTFDSGTLSFTILAFLDLVNSDSALNQTFQVCVFAQDPAGLNSPLLLPINYGDSKSNLASSSYNMSASGSVSHFPFDVYTGSLLLGAQILVNSTDNTPIPCDKEFSFEDNRSATRLPLYFGIGQDLDAFSADTDLQQLNATDPQATFGEGTVLLSVSVKRRGVIQFFAGLMFVATWLLTLGVLFSTAVILLKDDLSTRFDIIAACTGLLFALPSLRSATPGIPATPTVSDAVGYFWNIALLSLSTFVLMVHAILSMTRAKTAEGKGRRED